MILQNSLLNSLLAGKTGRAGCHLHCVASQPVQALEIFHTKSLESLALAGFLPLAASLCVPNLIFFRPTVPKVSAHLRHYSRFLEKRVGDWVRLHCVTGLAVDVGGILNPKATFISA